MGMGQSIATITEDTQTFALKFTGLSSMGNGKILDWTANVIPTPVGPEIHISWGGVVCKWDGQGPKNNSILDKKFLCYWSDNRIIPDWYVICMAPTSGASAFSASKGLNKIANPYAAYAGNVIMFVFVTSSKPSKVTSGPVASGCEGQRATIQCPSGQTIAGGTVKYGRWNNNVCHHGTVKRNTGSRVATGQLPKKCVGQNSCQFTVDNGYGLGDPYGGTYKHFEVAPQCLGSNRMVYLLIAKIPPAPPPPTPLIVAPPPVPANTAVFELNVATPNSTSTTNKVTIYIKSGVAATVYSTIDVVVNGGAAPTPTPHLNSAWIIPSPTRQGWHIVEITIGQMHQVRYEVQNLEGL